MSSKFTYSGNPSASSLDGVRFALGDTNPSDVIFTDDEINYLLSENGSINEAALNGAQAALAKFSRWVTSAAGDERKDLATRVEHFEKLVKQLMARRTKRPTGLYAGGISKTDKSTNAEDGDRDGGKFKTGMMDNPLSGNSSLTGDDT